MGIGVITYADIAGYMAVRKETLEPWEVDAITIMDCVYRAEASKVSQQ